MYINKSIILVYWNNLNYNLGLDLSYYRDKAKREIDLIVTDRENVNHLYEIKLNNKVDARMLKHFSAFGNDVGKGGIICTAERLESLSDKNDIIPLSSIIS